MKIDMGQVIIDLDGAKVTTGIQITWESVHERLLQILNSGGNLNTAIDKISEITKRPDSKKYVMLKNVCTNALMALDDKIEGDEHLKRLELARRLSNGVIDLSVEQIALIKKLISTFYNSPLIVGQAWIMLENKQKSKKPEPKDNGEAERKKIEIDA